jgi:hypothetical protein
MTELEKKALNVLEHVSMRMGSSGKRFRNDLIYQMRVAPEMKLTRPQALYLWKLVFTYRRQIGEAELLTPAAIAHKTNMLPDIYLATDHREPTPPRPRNGKFGGIGSGSREQTPQPEVKTFVSTQRGLFDSEAR